MSDAGSVKSYKFGTKNNWRRQVLNEALRRSRGRYRQNPILYLAGPGDIDREVAVSKGVPAQNMIAIDRCRANADRVRARGNPVVYGEALDVLWAWPEARPVSAVMLDFCSGLSARLVLGLPQASTRPPFAGACFIVNLLRGRDASTNQLRALAEDVVCDMWDEYFGQRVDPKHRGAILLAHMFANMAASDGDEGRAHRRLRWLAAHTSPIALSYRSGGLVMDSVAWTIPEYVATDHALVALKREMAAIERNEITRRRITAMLAIRTRRIAALQRGHRQNLHVEARPSRHVSPAECV